VNPVDDAVRMIVPAPVFTIPSIDDVSTLEYVSSPLSTLNVRMFPSNEAVAHAENIVTATPVIINSFFMVVLSLLFLCANCITTDSPIIPPNIRGYAVDGNMLK
jgi:hypothetical protein